MLESKGSIWIAIAGPVVSFALMIFLSLLQPIVGGFAPLLALAKYLVYINGTLAIFNLIPGFPSDGGWVFRAIERSHVPIGQPQLPPR